MGNKKAREFARQQELEAAWARARTAARAAVDDVHIPGIGARRLQVVVAPSFEPGGAWEIRQEDGTWTLYRSALVGEGPPLALVGYDPVPVEAAVLERYFRRTIALALPLEPDLTRRFGVDGTLHQLAVFGDAWTECRIQWWSDPPPQWKPVAELAEDMLRTFRDLP